MSTSPKRGLFRLAILAGAAIILVDVWGFVNLLHRPAIPREFQSREIVRADAFEIQGRYDLEFVLGRKAVGDEIELRFAGDPGGDPVRARLVAHYSQEPFPVIFILTAGLSAALGFVVFVSRREDHQARIFYWAALWFSAAVSINGSVYGFQGKPLNFVPGVVFNFAYPLVLAYLWRFTRMFKVHRARLWFTLVWLVALLIGGLLTFSFLYSQLKPSLAVHHLQMDLFIIFRLYVAVIAVASLAELLRAFRRSVSDEHRAQIKWIFFGLAAGVGPFVLLYQVPKVATGAPLLSEEFTSAFFLLLPVAFAVAILRFRLLNINLIINRSLVYSLLTGFIVVVYLAVVEILSGLFARAAPERKSWISLGAALLAATVINPGRKKIQFLVDKAFFRQSFDFRKAIRRFTTAAQAIFRPDELQALLAGILSDVLPVTALGTLVLERQADGLRTVLLSGLAGPAAQRVATLVASASGSSAWAREERVQTSVGVDFSEGALLASLGLDLIVPLPFGPGPQAGGLTFGPKKSGERYSGDDLDFLATLAGELAANLRKIHLQEEVVYERASREKSEELGRQKTEFISSVSHELRTPMSSLQSLSELLQSGKIKDEKERARLLELMSGECGRLSRFLHNVLDFGRIEQDTKRYVTSETVLQPVIREVVDIVRSGHQVEGLVVMTRMPDEPVVIEADADAVRQALLNLVDNAIKYGGEKKEVTVRLLEADDRVEIEVEDKGIGIEAGDREKLFNAFFRTAPAQRANPRGVGLGLKIVKHIMDGHGGRVGLRSEPGRGSTFSLIFPKRRTT